ncbi:MAG: haloacid dehalogenase type II [Steroidobacteraceae bacterium]
MQIRRPRLTARALSCSSWALEPIRPGTGAHETDDGDQGLPLRCVRYGTLFDFASAAAQCTELAADQRGPLTALWRDKQFQYTGLCATGPICRFLASHRRCAGLQPGEPGVAGPGLRERLMDLYLTPPVFQEVPQVLRQLRQAGFVTAILSNGSSAMLEAAVRGAGIDDLLDGVFSAHEVRQFKTHPRLYAHALHQLGLRPEQVSFQSSSAWDAHAASAFGMRVVWCNRYGQRRERLPGSPDREIRTLAERPELLEAPA